MTLPAPVRDLRPVPGDLCRQAALVSVAVGTWHGGLVGLALFLLVLGGTVVPRALGSSTLVDVTFCCSVVFGAWAAQLDWYVRIDWLDVAVHALVTGLVGAIALEVLVRVGLLPAGLPVPALLVVVTALGTTLAVVWELGEWFGHTFLDERIQVGYDDTVGDLAAGMAGAVLAALLVVRSGRRR